MQLVSSYFVMPGLVPGIHAFVLVDGRVKPTAVRLSFGGHGARH
jgi:hypothetical protein